MTTSKLNKINRKKYSARERKAYWVGVGASLANHSDFNDFIDNLSLNPNIQNSAINGYMADNYNNVSKKVFFQKKKVSDYGNKSNN